MEGQPSEAGTSLHGEIHSSGFPWPPITPYDVLSLVTIIVFGIAKAVTTSVGATIAPTTLEWVGGVIVFLLFYVIGWYKSHEPKAKWLEWFFNTKSQRFPRNLRKPTLDPTNETLASTNETLASTSETLASANETLASANETLASTDETLASTDETLALETKDTPIITGNRIFVSISVVLFGVAKAILTYRRLTTSANTVDWVFAIVVSSLTYWLEMYQDEAAYAWPSVFQTDYEPSLNSGLTFLGMTFNFSMGLILVSFWGYSLVLLWNWVPSKPPTKLPLPPSLDYIHFYSCKILLGCIFTPVFAGSIMLTSACGFYATFHPLLNILRMIRRSVLVCVASTSRFLNAISIAMTARGSVLNIFIPFGQVTSSVLVRVGFISLLQIVAESLSKTTFVQRIFRLFKIINFLSGFGLLYSFVLAIVSAIAPVGLWIPTIAAQDYTNLPNLLRVVYTFGCISISILSGTSFIKIGITLYEKLMTRSRYGVHGV